MHACFTSSCQVFAAHGISTNSAYFDLYRNIATGILSAAMPERSDSAEKNLKGMMFRAVNVLQVRGCCFHPVEGCR